MKKANSNSSAGTAADSSTKDEFTSVSPDSRKPHVSGFAFYGGCYHGVFGRRSRMTDKMNDNIKVPVEELQPFIDKAKLIVMELENHLNSFMVEPEKNTVVKWFPDSPMDTAGLKLCLSF